MSGEVLTSHKGLDVRHVVEVLTSHGRWDVRNEKRISNKSRRIRCLTMVKSQQIKDDRMLGMRKKL